MCSGNHILPRCNRFQKESVEGCIKFARKSGLCFNCLLQGHMVKSCPKSSFCKVTGCEVKHSTYLHSKPNVSVADKSCGPDGSYVPPNIKEYRNSDNHEIPKNGTNAQIDIIGAGVSNISLPLCSCQGEMCSNIEGCEDLCILRLWIKHNVLHD